MEGDIAVITGGGGALGVALGLRLLERGIAAIVLADIEQYRLDVGIEELQANNQKTTAILGLQVDAAQWNEQLGLFKKVEEMYGPPNLVFNLAGMLNARLPIPDFSAPPTGPPDVYWSLVDSHIKSSVHTVLAGVPSIHKSSRPNKVCILMGSVTSLAPAPFNPPYNIAKHAVLGCMLTYADAAKEAGVRLTSIGPDFTMTPFLLPLKPISKTWATMDQTIDGILADVDDQSRHQTFHYMRDLKWTKHEPLTRDDFSLASYRAALTQLGR